MSGPSPNEHAPTEPSPTDDSVDAVEPVQTATAAFDVAPELVAGSDWSA